MQRAALIASFAALVTSCAHFRPGAGEADVVRGIYCHPGSAINNRVWASYGRGYDVDAQEKHAGGGAIRCTNVDDVEAHGASQNVHFGQEKPRPLVVAGWAKLEGVTGQTSYRCSVYLDLALQNGKGWHMKIAAFDPAKTGWQYVEQIYEPPAPIASARVHVFLRQSKGTAWFDDIYVGEVLDDSGARSRNLLQDPGFEQGLKGDDSLRNEFFSRLEAIGCNAFHFYKSVGWQELMATEALPAPAPDDILLDFVRDAHRRGFKVWLTVGSPRPPIADAKSPEFPFYACVNGRWGELYTRTVAYFTQFGFDGIGVVPDEWTYGNGRVKRSFEKHKDPDVAKFYKEMPGYCDCEVCRREFKSRYGADYPDVRNAWGTADPAWARFTEFRYDSTSAWMQRTIEAAKRINPKVVTDTMICVLPVCSDNRLAAGAAWDKIGVDTDLDCLQTDPYIFLHNYLGDSTHCYATETAIHLAAANWRRGSGVTLEACRLRDKYRRKEPAEVYGAALSCLAHGSREFFWWHMNYIEGKVAHVEADVPARRVAAAYRVMKGMAPHLADAAVAGDVLVLCSRASEDTWDWLGKKQLLPPEFGEEPDPKRGFIAQKHALYFLLRRGCPFRMTYLDNPDPARLAAAKVAIVPFPFSLRESEVAVIEKLAREGKTVVLMSELSPFDELGQPLDRPRLSRLFGGKAPARTDAGPVTVAAGDGKIVFLGDDFAVQLFERIDAVRDPEAKVPLPAFDPERTAVLEQTLAAALGRPATVFASQPAEDVEVAVMEGRGGRLVLAINWESEQPAEVTLAPRLTRGFRQASGFAINAAAEVREVEWSVGGADWRLSLPAQEAVLVRLR